VFSSQCGYSNLYLYVISEKEHREHQLSIGSGDEKWKVCVGIQANIEDTPSRQS